MSDMDSAFLELVEKVRTTQKEYFRTRDRNVLRQSQALERRLDSEIQRIKEESGKAPKQGNLFEDSNETPSKVVAEVEGEVIMDFSDPSDIYNRILRVKKEVLGNALLKIQPGKVKIKIENL